MQNLSLVYFRYPRLASLVCDFFSLALIPPFELPETVLLVMVIKPMLRIPPPVVEGGVTDNGAVVDRHPEACPEPAEGT